MTRRVLIFVFLVILLALPVRAMEFSAPPPPESASKLLPKEAETFHEGLWNVLSAAAEFVHPALCEGVRCCLRFICARLLLCIAGQFSSKGAALELVGVAAVAATLLEPSAELMQLGIEGARELRSYGNLLLPVMAAALAAAGGITASGALYVGTALFDSILSTAVTALFVPMAGFYIALSIAYSATGENLLGKLRDLCRWCMEWALKLTLYLFTGYMTITGVISGTADAVAGKAAKITISGAVPVVGGILSDAAEAVVLSASVLGGSAGVWGILTVIAIFCAPAVAIGVRYLLLKVTAAVCSTLGAGRSAGLIGDLSAAMGLLLALVSTQAVLLLISSVCFLMGVAH